MSIDNEGGRDDTSEIWRVLVLRGFAALAFGLAAALRPEMGLPLLVTGFGVYLLSESAIVLHGAVSCARRQQRWQELGIYGVFALFGGVSALCWPGMQPFAMLYLVAAWAVAGGIQSALFALRFRRRFSGNWELALSGVTSLLIGVIAIRHPAVAVWIGGYATVLGVTLLVAGRGLRASQRRRVFSYTLANPTRRTAIF